jgi:putative tryptophan/tyrosine transport system substrate-binding protein
VLNPERYDLAAPNVAGVRFEVSAAAQLSRIREALPGAMRVGVLYDPDKSAAFVAAAERAAGKSGIRLVPAVVRDPREVAVVFRTIRDDVDALWLIPDSTVVTRESFEVLALQSAESKVPLVAFAEAFARQGALLALYPDPGAVGAECADLAGRILRGEAEPREIGIRHPARPLLAVNRRIEEQLGVLLGSGLDPDVEIR